MLGAVAGVVGGGALTACSATGGRPGPSPAPSTSVGSAPGGPTPQDLQDVRGLLATRARALVAGDDGAFLGTLSRADPAAEDRQVRAFRAARALGVSRVAVEDVRLDADPSALLGEPTLLATAGLRYRVDDLDRGDRTASVALRVARLDGRWLVVSEQPTGPGATAPWLALPALTVRTGRHAVVAGTVDGARLAEYAAVVDRALPVLRRAWGRAPDRVLVLAPATAEEADALLGRDGGSAAEVGATTEGPTDSTGRATGDRVVLDPTAFGRLTRAGRDVVLTHELVHVAVRATVPGRAAAWLTEGFADHVGYGRADVPVGDLLAPLLDEVGRDVGPPTSRAWTPCSRRRGRSRCRTSRRGRRSRSSSRGTARRRCDASSCRGRRRAPTPMPRPPPTAPWRACWARAAAPSSGSGGPTSRTSPAPDPRVEVKGDPEVVGFHLDPGGAPAGGGEREP